MHRAALLWFVLAVVFGAVLFQTSQKVTDGRTRLAVIESEIGKEEDSLRVLNAEWSYLNQPARLEELAARHLDLKPVTGRHFATPETLASPVEDKPAVVAAKATPVTQAPAPVMAQVVAPPARMMEAADSAEIVMKEEPAVPEPDSPVAGPAPVDKKNFAELMKRLEVR